MARRLIATGTTNADGKFVYAYTGSGAGKIDIVAQATIDGVTHNSETYALWDTFAYDNGTISSHKDIWDTYQCTLERQGTYSVISESTEYGFIRTKQENSIPRDCVIEFDYMNVDGLANNPMVQLQNYQQQYLTVIPLNYLNLNVGEWHHIKIEIKSGVMTVTNDKNSTVYTLELTISTANILLVFLTTGQTTEVRFKNFKAYAA